MLLRTQELCLVLSVETACSHIKNDIMVTKFRRNDYNGPIDSTFVILIDNFTSDR
jgi:hypothetical protein